MFKKNKDKLFIAVMIIVLGNIVYWTFYRIMQMVNGDKSIGDLKWSYFLVVIGFLGIIGILWLIRQNSKRNKANRN